MPRCTAEGRATALPPMRIPWHAGSMAVLVLVGTGGCGSAVCAAQQSASAHQLVVEREFSIEVPRCVSPAPLVDGYLLSTAPAGEYIDASQSTRATICYTDVGLEVVFSAVERNTFSTANECMAPVWEHGCAMELFIAPVRDRWDVPAEYQEIDGAPSGAIWGSCISAADVCPGCANVTDTTCAAPGAYECSSGEDLGRFTNGVVGEAEPTDDGWELRLSLPWPIFAEWAQPIRSAGIANPWPHWRVNLYRYNFYRGTEPDDFELDAWSPTFSPTFHDPRRFGHATMVSSDDTGAAGGSFVPELLSLCAEIAAAVVLVVVLILGMFGRDDSVATCSPDAVGTALGPGDDVRRDSIRGDDQDQEEDTVLLPSRRVRADSGASNASRLGAAERQHSHSGRCGLAPRHVVVVFTLLANMVCYADRTNISVAIVAMRAQYGWSEVQEGAILGTYSTHPNEQPAHCLSHQSSEAHKAKLSGSAAEHCDCLELASGAFFWGYILTQILGGWASARWGGRNVLLCGDYIDISMWCKDGSHHVLTQTTCLPFFPR